MIEYLHYFNFTLGILAIVLQIISIFTLILLFLVPKKNKFKNNFLSFISKHFFLIGFLISFFAVALSLFYSEIIGYDACSLCWWQRVFFFPQVILFSVAYFKKDRKVIYYAFPFLSIGLLISLYHNFIYYFGKNITFCSSSGVSCVQKFVNEISGYASIPMFSLTMFSSLIILLLVVYFYKNQNL